MQLRCWLIQLINSIVFTILLLICSPSFSPSTNLFPFIWIPKSPSPSPFLNKYSDKECYQNDPNIYASSPEQAAVSCRIETIRKEENYKKGLRFLCFFIDNTDPIFQKKQQPKHGQRQMKRRDKIHNQHSNSSRWNFRLPEDFMTLLRLFWRWGQVAPSFAGLLNVFEKMN